MPQIQNPTVDRIHSAALVLFAEKGYHGTTIRDIAKAAGISPATVYHYFPNKNKLFESLSLPGADIIQYRDVRQMEIAKAAMILLSEKGYANTTMNDIAKAAGISKPTLYQYFKGKESLFEFSTQSAPLRMTTRVLASKQAGKSIRSTLNIIGSEYINMFNDPMRQQLFRMTVYESYRFPEIGRQLFVSGVNITHSDFVKYISETIKCDARTLKEVRMAFSVFLGSLQSYVVSYKIIVGAENPIDWQEYLNTAVSFLCLWLERLGIQCN